MCLFDTTHQGGVDENTIANYKVCVEVSFLNLQTMASNWKVFAVQRIDPKVCLFVIKHKGGDRGPGEQPLPAPDTSPKVKC